MQLVFSNRNFVSFKIRRLPSLFLQKISHETKIFVFKNGVNLSKNRTIFYNHSEKPVVIVFQNENFEFW